MPDIVYAPGCVCDTCGKPYVSGEALYSIADKWDDEGRLVSFRHWECNETNGPLVQMRRAFENFNAAHARATDALDAVRRRVDPTPGRPAAPPRSTGGPSTGRYSGPKWKG